MKTFSGFIYLVLASFCLFAQPDFDVNYMNDFRRSFTFQPIYYPTLEGDSLDLIVPFRFTLNFLTFERASDNDQLFTNFLLDFVLRDENGIIKKNLVFKDTIVVSLSEKDIINVKRYINFVKVRIPIQKYVLEVSLYDKEKTKVKNIKTEIRYDKIGDSYIFNPIYASRHEDNRNQFVLSLSNNAFDFTKKEKVIILPVFTTSSFGNFKATVKSSPIQTHQMYWQKDIEFSTRPILLSTTPQSLTFDKEEAFFDVEQKAYTGIASKLNFYLIEFPEKFAFLQDYSLLIQLENHKDTINYNFKIAWENPPLSLRNINYAIEIMYYILTDEKYNYLLEQKRDKKWQEFFDIWRQFDTDTTTMFNEAMDEYYKRVDYAFLNFQTVTEPDGAKTERGKVFILYGKPSNIERVIDKDGVVTETWLYYRFKKKFTFVTKYKKFELMQISDI